jgi:virginiamycin B lyase
VRSAYPSEPEPEFVHTAATSSELTATPKETFKIGRVTASGVFVEFAVPTPKAAPKGLVLGPDGNVWFTEWGANRIGRITPLGLVAEYPVPTANSGLFAGIAPGPDGNVWFTETNKIGRVTPDGSITEFTLPTPNAGAQGVVTGSDGRLWFTEDNANQIGRVEICGRARIGVAVER